MTPTNTPAAAIWLEAAKVAEDITSANVQARRDRADDALAFEFDGLGKVIATALRERAKIAGDDVGPTSDSAVYDNTFYGILNAQGEFWTPLPFHDEATATAHLAQWGKGRNSSMMRTHKIVPVRIQLSLPAAPTPPSSEGGEGMGPDPGSSAYEAARKRLAHELWRIGADDDRNGFALMASELMAGHLMYVPTWLALQLIATPTQAPEEKR